MQKNTLFRSFLISTLVAFLCTPMVLADQWIHVEVESPRDEETVKIQLPMSLMSAAIAMIPDDIRMEGEIEIDDLDLDWHELMALWGEIEDAPDATFITIEGRDETVRVEKSDGFLLVRTSERGKYGSDVDIKLPLEVVDALLSGPEGTFDFEGALYALANFGAGELVTVRDGDETVKVWIADHAVAD